MILQAATEIATSNIELCCCLLQRITISRAIQIIDQRLASEIELRQRCRAEGRQLTIVPNSNDEKLPEQIRLHYGPFSSHQLAIYEDFVHFIPGFKPNDSEKRDLVTVSPLPSKHSSNHMRSSRWMIVFLLFGIVLFLKLTKLFKVNTTAYSLQHYNVC